MMRAWLYLVAAVLVAVVGFSPELVAQVATVPDAIPPSGPINYGAALVFGVLGSLGAGLVAKGAGKVDRWTGSADGALRNAVGPVLPILAGLTPLLASVLHLTNLPTADAIAAAPVSAVVGVVGREALRKWLVPFVTRLVR